MVVIILVDYMDGIFVTVLKCNMKIYIFISWKCEGFQCMFEDDEHIQERSS